jgi:hypothetical protein
MHQNQWLIESLNEEHYRELIQEAENARQAKLAGQATSENQSQNLLQKLYSELTSLSKGSQNANGNKNR